ncbi:MAG: HAD family hydrolase [Chloroflexi bacterium]|nr:HAD family hydrolase [Chloroflexota bacterium]
MIKAISFDGDDTLWDFEQWMLTAIAATLDELCRLGGLDRAPFSIEETRAIRDRIALERGPVSPDNTLDDIRLASWVEVASRAGLGHLGEALTQFYFRAREKGGGMLPDAEPVVIELRRKYRVGVLTNGNSTPSRHGSDLELDFIVMAQDYGIEKPSRRIYEITAEQAGCDVAELMHVGDSLDTDVSGANAAGATSVWLNRTGAHNDGDVAPAHEIRSLTEVSPLLARLNGA